MPGLGAVPATEPDDGRGREQGCEQYRAAAPEDLHDLGVRGPSEEAEQYHSDPPDKAAGGIPDQEPRVGHPAQPCQGRHNGAQERGEPGQQHCAAAPPAQEFACPVEPTGVPAEWPCRQHPRPGMLTNLVPDGVPDDGGAHDEH
jgi:hypothetical protein